MTLIKAQACAAAIASAGYDVTMTSDHAGSWTVRASSSNLDILISAADSLALAQQVTATAALVEFK